VALSPDQPTTVAETAPPAAQPTAQPEGAQAEPSLDDVLADLSAEYDRGTSEPSEPEKPVEAADTGNKFVTRAEFEALQANQMDADIDKAVAAVKEAGAGGSDRAIRAMLYQLADEKRTFKQAFVNRGNNPQGWDRALKAAAGEIGRELGAPVDAQVTADTEALAAAVRGSNSATAAEDDAPAFAPMSDGEFQDWKQKQG